MPLTEKPPTEQEFAEWLGNGRVSLPPVRLELLERQPAGAPGRRLDALVRVHWGAAADDFAVEYRRRATPQALQEAIQKVLTSDRPVGAYPMVIVPYLSDSQLQLLQEAGVSGVDLCGNGVVQVRGRLFVYRTGQPNRFPHSAPIKNIYRGVSSAVARVFLLEPRFQSVTRVRDTVSCRDVEVSLPTVSKVLRALQEDLIVSRGAGEIRLLQPEKLLDRLAENFREPEIRRYREVKVPFDRAELLQRFGEQADRYGVRWVLSGVGSAPRYSVMARPEILSIYCTDLHRLLMGIEVREIDRFPNLEVTETRDPVVYFDPRREDGCPWASPIETYLELLRGDKRERETAEQVRRVILAELEQRVQETAVT
jgi:hypothetical protein